MAKKKKNPEPSFKKDYENAHMLNTIHRAILSHIKVEDEIQRPIRSLSLIVNLLALHIAVFCQKDFREPLIEKVCSDLKFIIQHGEKEGQFNLNDQENS